MITNNLMICRIKYNEWYDKLSDGNGSDEEHMMVIVMKAE